MMGSSTNDNTVVSPVCISQAAQAMHVCAAAGGSRARMGLHVPTPDVM
jgi:hypothetical protein